MKSNMIVKIVAIALVGIGLMVMISKGRQAREEAAVATNQTAPPNLQEIEQSPDQADNGLTFDPMSDQDLAKTYGVDVDSPEETMRTLTRELQALRDENKRIQDENEELRDQTEDLLSMEDRVSQRVDSRVNNAETFMDDQRTAMEENRRRSETLINRLESRLKELETRATDAANGIRGSRTSASGYDIGSANIPDGLGYDTSGYGSEQIIWKNPLDAKVDPRQGTISLPDFDPSMPSLAEGSEIREGRNNRNEPESIKAYTLPQNSTLIGSTSMTALLGRIPVDGQIPDPYPFKIIVGPENLASNGITIPNVQGITMTGVAKGDWTLSCVSGEIHSMTFTFADGSISTYPEPREGDSSPRREPIAWFSDQYGIPCVTGERITNAPSYLASRIGLGALGAYASAIAAGEYTNTVSDQGTSTSTLTGDAQKAAQAQALTGGVNEVTDWVEKRQEQSFDAIYVAPGTTVHVHVDRQIAIDYPINGNGRKVQHDDFIDYQAANAYQTLD